MTQDSKKVLSPSIIRALLYPLDPHLAPVAARAAVRNLRRPLPETPTGGRISALWQRIKVKAYQRPGSTTWTEFTANLSTLGRRLNRQFRQMLPRHVIATIVESIARWCWKHVRPYDHSPAAQRRRGVLRGQQRRGEMLRRDRAIAELRRQGRSRAWIAGFLGVHRRTVYRSLARTSAL